MSLNKKLICFIMFCVSILFLIIHFVWAACVNKSIVNTFFIAILNIFPYSLPIICFGLAWLGFQIGKNNWNKADNIFALLFALCYMVMILHITIVGFTDKFLDIYFKTPPWYLIPFIMLLIFWYLVRTKPTKLIGYILFSLPVLTIAAMIVHSIVAGILAYIKLSTTPSYYSWFDDVATVIALYALAVLPLLIPHAVYHRIQKKKTASSDNQN